MANEIGQSTGFLDGISQDFKPEFGSYEVV
jgi:hypothetical protein